MDSDYKLPINIGSQEELSIINLANLIKRKINSNLKIVHRKLPNDDPMKRKPNLNLAKKIINWETKTNLEKGLDITIKYLSEGLK